MVKRREFIISTFLAGMGATLCGNLNAKSAENPSSIPLSEHEKLLKLIEKAKKNTQFLTMTAIDSATKYLGEDSGEKDFLNSRIAFFNDQLESASIPIPIFPHSLEQNPNNLNEVMVIPRRGKTCYEIDVIKNKISCEIKMDHRRFYGHGCYVPGTDLFFASTFSMSPSDATMILYDKKNSKTVREIKIEGGVGAHQCTISNDKKFVIMTFTQTTKSHSPSIAWFDINTGDLVKRVEHVPDNAEHFKDMNDHYVIFGGGISRSKDPEVLGSIHPDNKVNNFIFPDEYKKSLIGKTVSIEALEEKGMCFMANPAMQSLSVFNYKSGMLIKKFNINTPRGLSLSNDKKFLYVTTLGTYPKFESYIYVLNLETLVMDNKFLLTDAVAYSSHASKFLTYA